MAALASETSMRHLELYEQINSRNHIKGTNLETKLKFPALEIVFEQSPTNPMIFATLKNNLGLGQGDHTLYVRRKSGLIELGKVAFSMRTIHAITRIAKNFNPEIYAITEERGRYLLTDDDLVETIELGM